MKWILSKIACITMTLGAVLVLTGCETAPPAVTQPGTSATSGTTTARPGSTLPQIDPRTNPTQAFPSQAAPPASVIAPEPPQQQPPQPVVTAPSRSPAELALAEGVDIYNQGNNYPGAIKRLQEAKKLAADSVYIQQDADKYTAFAYCVTGRRPQCRQHFVMLLSKDSSYELSGAEATHPVWGPTFKEAKASMIKKPPVKK
jgi:hypothetical protein